MKREILCKSCEKIMRDKFPDESPYPGEYIKFVNGIAIMELSCDQCDLILNKGDQACAMSIYTRENSYFEWEDDLLDISDLNTTQGSKLSYEEI